MAAWSSHKQWHRAASQSQRAAVASGLNGAQSATASYFDLCKLCPAELATKAVDAGVTIACLKLRARALHLRAKGEFALAVKVRFPFAPLCCLAGGSTHTVDAALRVP